MAENRLTAKQVAAAKPGGKPLKDGGSLYGHPGERGVSWRFAFKFNGKGDRIVFGVVSLAEARKRRNAARGLLRQSPPVNPRLEQERLERESFAQAEAAAREKTVRGLFEDWMRVYVREERRDEGRECTYMFECDVAPVIGDMPAREVLPEHAKTIIDRILARKKKRKANMVLAMCKQMFAHGVVCSFVSTNPFANFKKQHAGGKEKPRERALSVGDLRELATKLPACGLPEPQQAAIKFLLATATRRGELEKAAHSELDLEKGEWNIPAANTKELRAHVVHLSEFAKTQLQVLLQYREGEGIYPAARALSKLVRDRMREKPLKNRTARHVGALRLSGGEWTIHDLRRTAATRMAALGVAPHVVEKWLSHIMPGVMSVYNREPHLPERREAFNLWGAQLERLFDLSTSNVVELPRASA